MMVLFISIFSVVIMNLVVAHMTNTYTRIQNQVEQEWQYRLAETVKMFILIEEAHPWRMLPAPLNIVPFLLSLPFCSIHDFYLWLSYRELKGILKDLKRDENSTDSVKTSSPPSSAIGSSSGSDLSLSSPR